MIVAITGGTGFIGRRLALENIETGHCVRVLTRRPQNAVNLPDAVQVYKGDLVNDIKALHRFVDSADIVFHCAAETSDQTHMYRVNVEGTRNLLEAASNEVGHWVQLSSVGAYGVHRQGAITEETPLAPAGTYEETKLESDRLVMEAEARGAVTFSILRPSNVFGPTMTNRSLFQLIQMIESGWFFFIGKPGASANYVHVDNVVKALCLCGTKATARGRVYNISDHRTLEEFAGTIANELGVNPPKLRLPEPLARTGIRLFKWFPRFPLTQSRVDALVNRATYPIDRIEQDLQYGHIVSMEDGLRQLTEVWRQRRQESNSVWSYPAH